MAWLQNKILVERFNQGDISALQEIYNLYKRNMMTLATGLVFDRSMAEDVLHEVFAKLLGLQGHIRINSTLRGYLLQAVANEARTKNRIWSRQGHEDIPILLTTDKGPEQTAEHEEQRQRLKTALAALLYEQREVVLLRHYGQMKFKAIAKCQGVSMSAVQARYRYGLKRLRSLLRGEL